MVQAVSVGVTLVCGYAAHWCFVRGDNFYGWLNVIASALNLAMLLYWFTA